VLRQSAEDGVPDNARIVLGLLESVERDGARSQRKLASDLGIALGLVNAYLKRCVKKGLVKVREAPARRYVYYLTPHGFAEKSKLTVDYLSYSFSFFRQARADCAEVLVAAKANGVTRIALAGASDLTDIFRICTLECGVEIAAVVAAPDAIPNPAGVAVAKSFDDVTVPFDAVVVTDLQDSSAIYADAVARFGAAKVYAPKLLGLSHYGAGR
jgi:DNA-binding MarR family transcriptional regulator